jgi:hypothetical protein
MLLTFVLLFLSSLLLNLTRLYLLHYLSTTCLPKVSNLVSGRLNVVKDLKPTNQIVSFGRSRHLISLLSILVIIYLARHYFIGMIDNEYGINTLSNV